MDRFEQLKTKYAKVLDLIKQKGVSLSHLHLQNDKLVIQGAAPSEPIKNDVWNAIKAIDPGYSDLSADISVDSSLPQPAAAAAAAAGGGSAGGQTYTVAAGDSLSKIAKQFYGNANDYMKIFEANKNQLTDPNTIKTGQKLVIPPK